jgi:hypothetical protein
MKRWINKHYPLATHSFYITNYLENQAKLNLDLLHDEIILYHFFPKILTIFNELLSKLTNCPFDRMIAGLLNPFYDKRLSLEQALCLL